MLAGAADDGRLSLSETSKCDSCNMGTNTPCRNEVLHEDVLRKPTRKADRFAGQKHWLAKFRSIQIFASSICPLLRKLMDAHPPRSSPATATGSARPAPAGRY